MLRGEGEEAGGPGGGGERGGERERPSERHGDSLEEVCRRASAVWAEVFPVEMSCIPAMVGSQFFLRVANVCYSVSFIATVVYITYLIAIQSYVDNNSIPLMVLMHIQGVLFLIMPYVCYYFYKMNVFNSDLIDLIKFALEKDSNVKLKLAALTHLNTVSLCFAMVLLVMQASSEINIIDTITTLLLCIFYLAPLNIAVSLAACVIELHRINIQHYRDEINDSRAILDAKLWKFRVHRISMNSSDNQRDSEVEMNTRLSYNCDINTVKSIDDALNVDIFQLRRQYQSLYGLCLRTSQQYGLYLLFFIFFGFLYASATLLGIYMEEYPSKGIAGFVLVGFFIALALGATLTACNETGHLVCRDLSSYVMSLSCLQNPSDKTGDGRSEPVLTRLSTLEKHKNGNETLTLLSGMASMKLQICYIGNMALRSSLSFAVLGSILVAVIPIVIEKELN